MYICYKIKLIWTEIMSVSSNVYICFVLFFSFVLHLFSSCWLFTIILLSLLLLYGRNGEKVDMTGDEGKDDDDWQDGHRRGKF